MQRLVERRRVERVAGRLFRQQRRDQRRKRLARGACGLRFQLLVGALQFGDARLQFAGFGGGLSRFVADRDALVNGGDDAVHLGIQFLVLRVEAADRVLQRFGGGGQPGRWRR